MGVSTLFFFVLTIGLGFLIDILIKDWDADFFEKLVMRMGLGIILVPLVGILLNLLKIPLDWKVFLILSLATIAGAFYKRKEEIISDYQAPFSNKNILTLSKNKIYGILVLIMFIVTVNMYVGGSFAYPWLEDGDPYGYALASKYIAEEKTFSTPIHFSHYSEPYTQGYQILMGILHQTNDSIYWNMKFFNALIISFSILFFYCFVRRFSKNLDISLISTFALFAMPAWVGHFIFSLNFNMALLPVFLYTLVKIDDDKRWKYLAILSFASILVNHAYTAITITMFFILYMINYIFVKEEFNKELFQVFFYGAITSLLFYIPAYSRHSEFFYNPVAGTGGIEMIIKMINQIISNISLLILTLIFIGIISYLYFAADRWFKPVKKKILHKKDIKHRIFFSVLGVLLAILVIPNEKFISVKGSGTRSYTLSDFFIAQKGNLTNNPIGVGVVLMIFFTVGLVLILYNYNKIFKGENFWISTTLIWTIVSLLIIFGMNLSIMYIPFRMWTFFALFASLIIGYFLFLLLKSIQKTINSTVIKLILISLIIIFVIGPGKVGEWHLGEYYHPILKVNLPRYISSFSQKYWHNTATWPEHQVMVPESQNFYVELRDGGIIPKDSSVYPLCHQPSMMYGYDMNPKTWQNKEVSEYYIEAEDVYYFTSLNKTLQDNYDFLKRNEMDYVALGASCVAKHKADINLLNNRLQEMVNSSNFKLVYNTQSEFLFKAD